MVLIFLKGERYGGDVAAGDGFNNGYVGADNCANPASNIVAFARTEPPLVAGRYGSSTSFAAYAQGSIRSSPVTEFKYGFLSGLPGNPSPNLLSFSNTVASQLGGSFGVQRTSKASDSSRSKTNRIRPCLQG